MIHAIKERIANYTGVEGTFKYDIWMVATVIACVRTRRSSKPWTDEKSGEVHIDWPMEIGWQCTVVHDNRIIELLLEDTDKGKTWLEV